jgi:CDP-glycerol glycerophosphotransferase (TagB/SpsB family)
MPTGKKTILYLPTWGNNKESMSSISVDVVNKLLELKKRYFVTIKTHNITSFAKNEEVRRKLFDEFDTVYDASIPIADILDDADVVLSDLSSAAFDAVAGNVPLALFGLGEPIYLGGKLCLHQQLVIDDIIPGTDNPNELEIIIEKALTHEYFIKQQKLKSEMFKYEGQACLKAFMEFQNALLEDHVDLWYIATRRAIREYRHHTIKEAYENSTSWKITKPLRVISRLIKGSKHG